MPLNKVFLMGNLTREPELRYTPGGAAVCEFGIAINRTFTSNNQTREEVCFVDIVVWGKSGELCQRYLNKGSQALIEGRLQYDQWEDKNTGKRSSRLRVIAENVQFVGAKREGAEGGNAPQQGGNFRNGGNNYGNQGGYGSQNYAAPAQPAYQAPQPAAQPSYQSGSNADFRDVPLDDDLPF